MNSVICYYKLIIISFYNFQLYTSVYYMLSDLYLPCYFKASSPSFENLMYYNSDVNLLASPSNEQFMFSINIDCLSLSPSNYLLFIAWRE